MATRTEAFPRPLMPRSPSNESGHAGGELATSPDISMSGSSGSATVVWLPSRGRPPFFSGASASRSGRSGLRDSSWSWLLSSGMVLALYQSLLILTSSRALQPAVHIIDLLRVDL